MYRHSRLIILLAIILCCGCSSYQPTKNVWKTTKGLWNTYVSPPADVDYEDKGDLSPQSLALSKAMIGVDKELSKLERAMQNADKPPTQEWLDNLFASFGWLDGFAGIKYNGEILGQQPPDFLKELDFNPLLYEDKKQNSRAIRADVQPSPLGPEIMLATPLYDGIDFLGIVVAYFDMRSLMTFSTEPQNIVVLCPTALLWPGKYDFAATPLAGVDWAKAVAESSAGTCSNAHGTFYYMVRYLGNLPLIFATPQSGTFPDGTGAIEQGFAFFPKEREKLPPPPVPEGAKQRMEMHFAEKQETEQAPQTEQPVAQEPVQQSARAESASSNEIQPGSRDSVLLKSGRQGSSKRVRERDLEGENVPVERVERPRTSRKQADEKPIELIPESNLRALPGNTLSPFGPEEEEAQKQPEAPKPYTRPSPFGPAETREAPATQGASDQEDSLADGEKTSSAPSAARPKRETTSPAPAAKNVETEDDGLADGERTPNALRRKNAGSAAPAPQSDAEQDDNLADGEKSSNVPRGPARMPDGRPSPFGPAE